jgi:surface antigen
MAVTKLARVLVRFIAAVAMVAAFGLAASGAQAAGGPHAVSAHLASTKVTPQLVCCGGGGSANITGTVESSPSLNRRGGPGTGYNIHGTVSYGSHITIACFEWGNSVTATWPDGEKYSTTVWDALTDTSAGGANGLYVSDAWVNTGGDTSTMVPECSNVTANPAYYPWAPVGNDSADGHGYLTGECTSFASWEVRADSRIANKSPDWMGNAEYWTGLSSSSMPHVGDVAQWDPNHNGAGANGHVAIVAAVYYDSQQILVYEYNFKDSYNGDQPLRLSERTISWSAPSRYLQFS